MAGFAYYILAYLNMLWAFTAAPVPAGPPSVPLGPLRTYNCPQDQAGQELCSLVAVCRSPLNCGGTWQHGAGATVIVRCNWSWGPERSLSTLQRTSCGCFLCFLLHHLFGRVGAVSYQDPTFLIPICQQTDTESLGIVHQGHLVDHV